MAKATHVTNLNTTENVVTSEIFGGEVKSEIARAKTALKDFKDFNQKIRKDYKILVAQLEACTQKGQVTSVMASIRRKYM